MPSTGKPFRAGVIIGASLAASPVLGILITAFGMSRAFGTLQDSGISDPQALSRNVAMALLSNAASLVLCPVGVVILVLSLVLRSRAQRETPPPLPPGTIGDDQSA